ncbi:uncharacterized protein Z519_11904 [Cladophialophora bantiana CBS 173.52]|uniref:EthD domain-containing protein n=1 Tax=Cladophialophora bantiana (strain ATCC 10958 / CBS 173.52 / CDC B-1940 / NIH 8579) TaxID=1442370 RepID=A0A0D2HT28_CLAB1|nr:uncharacterized protein Z519_11904 [Cladophialophora bantiana CBS 173.52]KIW87579.1 hypothetical protein Z519_11904 [Cladophialophora bantiana CBS 173.52]
MGTAETRKLFSITVFGHKRADMSENDYHAYISKTHSGHLKALLAKNDIVSYTMQHNSSDVNKPYLEKVYGAELPAENVSDCDAVIQIVFKDIEDYLRVRTDPHFVNVVNPDHHNFADPTKTRFSMGWFEVHVSQGKVVS